MNKKTAIIVSLFLVFLVFLEWHFGVALSPKPYFDPLNKTDGTSFYIRLFVHFLISLMPLLYLFKKKS